MQPSIHHIKPETEFFIPEGCYIIEMSTAPDDPEMSIARARVEPGVTTEWHRLIGTTERYVITAGQGRVEVGDLPPTDVKPGDVVVIPPMTRQRITNTGATELLFLAICTPPFKDEVYEMVDE